MREKLLNLICDSDPISHDGSGYVDYTKIADHLIANGVTFAEDKKPMTNGDRIRAMSDEELARALLRVVNYCPPGTRPSPDMCAGEGCIVCWRNWLNLLAEVDHDAEA